MNAEIIVVGSQERVADAALKNAEYLRGQLKNIGITLSGQSAALTNPGRLERMFASALDRSDVVIITGGLGVEKDDISKDCICQTLGLSLELNEEVLSRVKAYVDRAGESMNEAYVHQAMFPRHAVIFKNQIGVSCGFAIKGTNKQILLLPVQPEELTEMFESEVLPFLERNSSNATANHILKLSGLSLVEVQEKLGALTGMSNPSVEAVEKDGEVFVQIHAMANTRHHAENACAAVVKQVSQLLGDAVYGQDEERLEQVVCQKLHTCGKTVSLCELGSANAIGKRLLSDKYGVSVLLDSGMNEPLSYLPKKITDKYSPVSKEAAAYLAKAASDLTQSSFGVAFVSPTQKAISLSGKTPKNLVYAAVYQDGKGWVQEFPATAQSIEQAGSWAFQILRLCLDGSESVMTQAYEVNHAGVLKEPKNRNEQGLEQETTENSVEQQKKEKHKSGKKPWYKKVLGYCIPSKNDSVGEIIRKIFFTLGTLVCIGCLIFIAVHYASYFNAQRQNESLKHLLTESTSIPSDYPENYLEKFAGLYKINPDIAGWLEIENTGIDYPVVQGEDNNTYLDRNFRKKKDKRGTIFMDYRNDARIKGSNMVLYGSNLNDSTMFSNLVNYKEISYYQEHPIIQFDTVYEEAQWKIIGAFLTTSEGTDTNSLAFGEFLYPRSQEDFDWYINEVSIRSYLNTGVDVEFGDTLLTLATPTEELNNGYFVVVARQVRDGEGAEVDTAAATQNTSPLMPESWYLKYGGSAPSGVTATPNPLGGYANVKENMFGYVDPDAEQTVSSDVESEESSSPEPEDTSSEEEEQTYTPPASSTPQIALPEEPEEPYVPPAEPEEPETPPVSSNTSSEVENSSTPEEPEEPEESNPGSGSPSSSPSSETSSDNTTQSSTE